MVTTTGLVECFVAAAGGSFVQVKNSASGVSELFVLYFKPAEPSSLSAMWAAMISAARANGKTVSIVHAETSGQIGSLTIGDNPFI